MWEAGFGDIAVRLMKTFYVDCSTNEREKKNSQLMINLFSGSSWLL